MDNLLEQFWKWAEITPLEYANTGLNQKASKREDEFPCFRSLISYAKKIVDKNPTEQKDLDDLLTILALDNEAEEILDYLEQNGSYGLLENLMAIARNHIQPEAKWQLAELVFRRKPDGYVDFLIVLANDYHPYVKKRAENCLKYLNAHNTT